MVSDPTAWEDRPLRPARPWRGEPGTAGTVAVVGMGKIGLPLAAQYAEAGWHVIGVDVPVAPSCHR